MQFRKGAIPWNKGVSQKKEVIEKIRKSRLGQTPWNKGIKYLRVTGEKNVNWKGNKVGYFALHTWISRRKGKAFGCSQCGLREKNIKYEWANISGEYRRDENDFRSLCIPCHRKETFERGEVGYYYKGIKPPKHQEGCQCFRCTGMVWNKGLRGKTVPWNKGKKTGLVPKTAFKKGVAPEGSVLFKKGHIPWNKKNKSL